MAALGVFALFAYIYFIGLSVLSVVDRKETERMTGRVGAEVAGLESEYAALDQRIDLLAATTAGFKEVTDPRYVNREGERETLSLRDAAGGR